MGELVELHVTLDKDHAIASADQVRFDILEFDWLFTGVFDDAVTSLKAPGADPPLDTDFTVVARQVATATTTAALPTLRDVVDDFRIAHPDDYEQSILLVTDATSGVVDLLAWWRATFVAGEDAPTLYFVAEIPGHRSSSTVALHVAPPVPGVNVRLTSTVREADRPVAGAARPLAGVTASIGARSTATSSAGFFAMDLRLPLGPSRLTLERSGISSVVRTITVSERADHGFDVLVTDEDGAPVVSGSLGPGAGDQEFVLIDLTLRPVVHRLSGTVVWPSTWDPAAARPLAGRYVYALPLAAGAALPQRPRSSLEWEALRTRSGVLRSARPEAPDARQPTDATGRFEISFVDFRPDAQYLLWVDGPDPRNPGTRVCEAIVRTVDVPDMRDLAFTMVAANAAAPELANGPMDVQHTHRKVVDSSITLKDGGVGGACEVVRVVDAGTPQAPDLRLVRPGRANQAGFDAAPPVGTESIDIVDAAMESAEVLLEVLPLLPVFESPDRRSEPVRAAIRTWLGDLDTHFPRGYLTGNTRWVLDARRTPVAAWTTAANCSVLERTLLTHPLLKPADLNSADWRWWRADAVSAADFARIRLDATRTFAVRLLAEEYVAVLEPPVPRLLAMFENRHAHLSPGHGVYCDPPELGAAAAYRIRTQRGDWAGNDTVHPNTIDNWGGEDENVGAMAMHLRRITAANGLSTLFNRESLDPTLLGIVQDGGAFATVDPRDHPDYPRLWQQNAYYWIAADWDLKTAGAPIVRGHAVVDPAANSINAAAGRRRTTLLEQDVGSAVRPVDAFVPIHTNAASVLDGPRKGELIPAQNGLDVMYLDIRPAPGPPDPGTAGYHEGNTLGLDAAQQLTTGITAEVGIRSRGVVSYWAAQGNTAIELANTVHHWRDGDGSRDQRALIAGGVLGHEVTFPPGAPRPDVPIAYVELGYHTNPQEGACLAQGWFRHAGAVGIAKGLERIIALHSRPVDWSDVRRLLTRNYGAIASVNGLIDGVVPMTPPDVTDHLRAVTGSAGVFVATTVLSDLVATIEDLRLAVTRVMVAQGVADAVATVAGWPAAAQQEDRAKASLGPVMRALTAPVADGMPDTADLPRGARPATRADLAAAIGAAIGVRPLDLATVTKPVNGVTVLPGIVPEAPEAFLTAPTLADVVTALGTLKPADVWRPTGVRITDARGTAVSRVIAGETVVLAVELAGTAWRGAPGDVRIVVSRGGATVAALTCATRTTATLTSAPWVVAAGNGAFSVSVEVKHPDKGTLPLAAVPGSIEVGAR
jgi:hypothetical protein